MKIMFPQKNRTREHNAHHVSERVGACRRRLRRSRAMQKAAAVESAEPEMLASAPRLRAFEGQRGKAEAETISSEAQSQAGWIEEGSVVAG